ncbi:MAG: hypothetical protein KC586_09345 [Myxococcales bacterium]|nr:hypothetical protein [Myxococcales bacterium]
MIRPRELALEAARHPGALVPCPWCGSSVGAAKLERHLDEVHADAPAELPHVEGPDAGIYVPMIVLGVLGIVAFGITVAVAPEIGRLATVVPLVTLGVAFGVSFLAWRNVVRARLRLEREMLVLRSFFGLRRRRLVLSHLRVETGSVMGSRPAFPGDHHGRHEEIKVGNYLRLSDGTTTLTLASSGAGARKRWKPDGVRQGPKRQWVDVWLPTSAMVAVELLVHAHGGLRVREAGESS